MFFQSIRVLLSLLLVAVIIGGPFAYASHNLKQIRNFRVLVPGKVYRSGQASLERTKKTIEELGIKSVISLRDARPGASTAQYDAEENLVRSMGLNYLKLTPRAWGRENGQEPEVQPNVDQFLKLLDNPKNYPIWIHCFAGTHRTGAYCAIYRMEYEHWSNEKAMAELKELGYINLDNENIHDYLDGYKPRWKK
ncbi:tyrosine-protein phosphatase [Telmatocola sphagniphila]|uniref:Tyrosine-protein phosphatase n=1 Tax=Telmatocola sphagniphila TaxID=1123043 RepID=A0A8E6BAW6_9BACT|nr:tyrosine-protein phosphatase [Telmatocola sphagniphila]QVL34664.1 tyrosine-protein phosphatase [Telmatocola sphagniphila]